MQSLAQIQSTAGGKIPLRRIERLDANCRDRECSSFMVFVRRHWTASTCSLFTYSSCSSSSSPHGRPSRGNVAHSNWRSGSSRVMCMQDDRVSKSELKEITEIVLRETTGEESTSQMTGNSYFSGIESAEIAERTSPVATKFDARHPFDLRWIGEWADALTERGMRKGRTFYSHDDWLRHRSSTRHYRHFASSFSSRAILSLIPPVGTMTAISLAVTVYNTIVLSGYLPSFIPLLHASSLSYQLTAPALALLLVFRTEASYSRYDEARKTWTKVVSSSKNMARQSMAWAQSPADHQRKKLLLDYILAFPVALKVLP